MAATCEHSSLSVTHRGPPRAGLLEPDPSPTTRHSSGLVLSAATLTIHLRIKLWDVVICFQLDLVRVQLYRNPDRISARADFYPISKWALRGVPPCKTSRPFQAWTFYEPCMHKETAGRPARRHHDIISHVSHISPPHQPPSPPHPLVTHNPSLMSCFITSRSYFVHKFVIIMYNV